MTSRPRPKPPVLPAVLDRLTRASVALISALAVGALVLILLGYRPLVVRSASMTPTIQIGTTVIVEQVPASDVRLGDIVTFADPEGDEETITHRVRAMSLGRQRFYFETRGDANTFSEFWDVPATSTVEREVWRVPFIGLALSKLNSHPRTGLAGLVAVIVGFVALEGIAGRSRKHEDQHEDHDFGRKRWARR